MRNLDKYKKDLRQLIKDGVALQFGMYQELGKLKDEAKDANIEPLAFKFNYETWYSESREVIRQLLPNRLEDFIKLYEKDKKRKVVDYENYVVSDYMIGLVVEHGYETRVDTSAAISKFQQQLLILKSAEKRLESSLFDIRQLVQADIFDSELDTSRELNKNGYIRAAGALAGVVIETHLQAVCQEHKLTIKKKDPGINDLAHILKEADVIDTPGLRRIQILADLRNLCDHKKTKEPNKTDVNELIDGADKLIKTIF
jgi:hypothetical protein